VEILNRDNKQSTTIHTIYKTEFTRSRSRPRPVLQDQYQDL